MSLAEITFRFGIFRYIPNLLFNGKSHFLYRASESLTFGVWADIVVDEGLCMCRVFAVCYASALALVLGAWTAYHAISMPTPEYWMVMKWKFVSSTYVTF